MKCRRIRQPKRPQPYEPIKVNVGAGRFTKIVDHCKEFNPVDAEHFDEWVDTNYAETQYRKSKACSSTHWKIIHHIGHQDIGLLFHSPSNAAFTVQISDIGETSPTGITGLMYTLNEDYSSWTPYTLEDEVSVPAGSTISWKASTWSLNGDLDDVEFVFTGAMDLVVEGDITWLCGHTKQLSPTTAFPWLFCDSTLHDAHGLRFPSNTTYSCYLGMFSGCENLLYAPELPALELSANCYFNMFQMCTALLKAPVLPATHFPLGCYGNMFLNCTSLTKTPLLHAQVLAPYSYAQMFSGCTSLVEVYVAASDIRAENCLLGWLQNVAPTGIFHCKPQSEMLGGVQYPSGQSGVPEGWLVVYNL